MIHKAAKQLKLTILFLLSAILTFAQEDVTKTTIDWSGFINVNYLYDSRQTITAREGAFLLFPEPELLDPSGQDINATPNFNILAIRTRLKASIKGPDFLHFKTSGAIEADFAGQSNEDINGVRLRHAWLKLSGKKVDYLFGQYWHPMFVTDCYPGTYSFNTGVPFQPLARNPQFRITTQGKWKAIGVLYTHRDHTSKGPDGSSSDYLRNAAVPGIHGQLQYDSKKLSFGLGADYKTIRPRLTDSKGELFEQTISSFAFLSWVKFEGQHITFKSKATWGENLSDLLMIGGYAEKQGEEGFSNIANFSAWSELSGSVGYIEWGLFGGYSKNLGPEQLSSGLYYGLGTDIQNMYRVAPRIGIKSGKTTIGLEVEYTSAKYGAIDKFAANPQTTSTVPVNNIRVLGQVMYKF